MHPDYDLIIFGSGFGGSLLGAIARRLGRSVLLLERDAHPRFAIGESTSPLTNLLLEELARRYDLPALLPLATYGEWRQTYPEIGCGLKRGFTFYAHRAGEPHRSTPDRSTQLLVAASPHDVVSDTHWLRADVDHFLVRQAIEAGVEYRDRTSVQTLERNDRGGWRMSGEREGREWQATGRLLIDATGPRGLLSRLLDPAERPVEAAFPDVLANQALFTHFTEVRRCDAMEEFHTEGAPPYAPDDAALHHLFDGGWIWVLRFNNGVASAGASLTDAMAQEIGLPGDGATAWQRLMARLPSVEAQFAEAQPTRPFVHSPRMAWRASRVVGEGWALLPSAAAFVDPLFSTGIPLTLLGIERLARLLEAREGDALQAGLAEYEAITLAEADHTARYVGACIRAASNFPLFAALSMFYFAAASYSEMARRLEKRHLVRRFLAADRTDFTTGMARCIHQLPDLLTSRDPQAAETFAAEAACAISTLNIAGLAEPFRRNWYPVDLEDLIREAGKLEMTPEQMRGVLKDAPWAQIPDQSF